MNECTNENVELGSNQHTRAQYRDRREILPLVMNESANKNNALGSNQLHAASIQLPSPTASPLPSPLFLSTGIQKHNGEMTHQAFQGGGGKKAERKGKGMVMAGREECKGKEREVEGTESRTKTGRRERTKRTKRQRREKIRRNEWQAVGGMGVEVGWGKFVVLLETGGSVEDAPRTNLFPTDAQGIAGSIILTCVVQDHVNCSAAMWGVRTKKEFARVE
ncbi:hypothetical protein BDQ17DRAFT_1327287 [Cyathus striatus]|nr:hypothetical protein BDQ17DRAFT_1327287 [Cyathus striatus]